MVSLANTYAEVGRSEDLTQIVTVSWQDYCNSGHGSTPPRMENVTEGILKKNKHKDIAIAVVQGGTTGWFGP